MNRLPYDPSANVCPDFMDERYRAGRTVFVTPNISEVQAAATLRGIWVTTNDALCVQWQQQVIEDDRLRTEQQRLAEEEEERSFQAIRLEEETAQAEEKKKNRSKYHVLPERPRPTTTEDDIIVSDFAMRKIDKGLYVEIYYWTNDGLDDALANYHTKDDDGMVPTTGEDGSTTWIQAAATRPSAGVVPDRNLAPVDFAQAVPRMIASFEERGWPKQRVLMLARFWGALMIHRHWNSRDKSLQKGLLLYQEEQRRAWHNAIPIPANAWDISITSESAISRTCDRVYRDDRNKQDLSDDYKKSQGSNLRIGLGDSFSNPRGRRSRRSVSPNRKRCSASPTKRSSAPRTARAAAGARSGFPAGVHNTRSPAVCAVCLGRNSHSFIECTAERLWDSAFPSVATRSNKQLLLRSSDKPLCVDWQRAIGCSSHSHSERHVCSGCLATTHGAQNCPRAQTLAPGHSL
ncbi:hypothetical protein EDB19DRAFT_1741483 [Suillus lakei]|nr:hypothetical protein EDB19DRAFT_1741483 [Suillus lakei]